ADRAVVAGQPAGDRPAARAAGPARAAVAPGAGHARSRRGDDPGERDRAALRRRGAPRLRERTPGPARCGHRARGGPDGDAMTPRRLAARIAAVALILATVT